MGWLKDGAELIGDGFEKVGDAVNTVTDPKKLKEFHWKFQETALERMLANRNSWTEDSKKECRELLQWWKEMDAAGKSRQQISKTIKDYIVDEYELYLRTQDEATQQACTRKKPSFWMTIWGDPCQTMFDKKSDPGFYQVRWMEVRLLTFTYKDSYWKTNKDAVAYQLYKWYFEYWMKTTPEGILQEMFAGAIATFAFDLPGNFANITSIAKTRMKFRTTKRLPASNTRRKNTGQKVDAEVAAQGGPIKKKAWPVKEYFPDSGIPKDHFDAILEACDETGLVAIFRPTNKASMRWIKRGYPAKPLKLKVKTSKKTGIVTSKSKKETADARDAGYFVVDDDGVPRNKQGQEMKLPKKTEWDLEPGQVIDPKQKKPVVGDYDLLAVVDPKNMGQNVTLAVDNGKPVKNRSNPKADELIRKINEKLDQKRVHHGAQDQFDDFAEGEGAYVFVPGKQAMELPDEGSVRDFYKAIKRETIKGSYNKKK